MKKGNLAGKSATDKSCRKNTSSVRKGNIAAKTATSKDARRITK